MLANAPRYELIPLPVPGDAGEGRAADFNDPDRSGSVLVVGAAAFGALEYGGPNGREPFAVSEAACWEVRPDGIAISRLPGEPGRFSAANGVNDAGRVVGSFRPGGGFERPFVWDSPHTGGQPRRLDPDRFLGGTANAVDASGRIGGARKVRVLGDAGYERIDHPVVWDPHAHDDAFSARALHHPERPDRYPGRVTALAAGWAIGSTIIRNGRGVGVRWDLREGDGFGRSRVLHPSPPHGTLHRAADVNAGGAVVGVDRLPTAISKPFLFEPNAAGRGLFRHLPTPEDAAGSANAINEAGMIGGSLYGRDEAAVLWINGERLPVNERLTDAAGWSVTEIVAMNESGWLCGAARAPGERRGRPVLLRPL